METFAYNYLLEAKGPNPLSDSVVRLGSDNISYTILLLYYTEFP